MEYTVFQHAKHLNSKFCTTPSGKAKQRGKIWYIREAGCDMRILEVITHKKWNETVQSDFGYAPINDPSSD